MIDVYFYFYLQVNVTITSTKNEAYTLKDFMRKKGQDKIREQLSVYIKELKEGKFGIQCVVLMIVVRYLVSPIQCTILLTMV